MHAVVLFAHGSRDPSWSGPIEAVATRMRERDATALVRCAYLEIMQPDLPGAVASLIATGATHIDVLPMFLGLGRHAREDLPALVDGLRKTHPTLELTLRPAIGEDPRLVELIAQIGLS